MITPLTLTSPIVGTNRACSCLWQLYRLFHYGCRILQGINWGKGSSSSKSDWRGDKVGIVPALELRIGSKHGCRKDSSTSKLTKTRILVVGSSSDLRCPHSPIYRGFCRFVVVDSHRALCQAETLWRIWSVSILS